MELILASGSARRRELMHVCGYDFTVIPSTAEERAPECADPGELVKRLALQKACAVFDSLDDERRKNAAVLGSDTVVVLNGRVLGKPRDEAEAFRMLRAESGRENTVYTGVALVTGVRRIALFDSARVRFAELTDEEISAYIKTGEPMDKAGAYGIQGLGSMFITGIDGSYFTVVGLPVHIVYGLLKDEGILPAGFGGNNSR